MSAKTKDGHEGEVQGRHKDGVTLEEGKGKALCSRAFLTLARLNLSRVGVEDCKVGRTGSKACLSFPLSLFVFAVSTILVVVFVHCLRSRVSRDDAFRGWASRLALPFALLLALLPVGAEFSRVAVFCVSTRVLGEQRKRCFRAFSCAARARLSGTPPISSEDECLAEI